MTSKTITRALNSFNVPRFVLVKPHCISYSTRGTLRTYRNPYVRLQQNFPRTMSKRSHSPDDTKKLYHEELRHPSTKRAKEIDEHKPLEKLIETLSDQKTDHPVRNVLHWFRSKDVRQEDNKALNAASQKAREGNGFLITMYLFAPEDMEWHGTSPARSDFLLQSLDILKKQLQKKHIPLAMITADKKGDKDGKVMQFIKDNDISHVFANYEYEVDELRRDIKIAKHLVDEKEISFELFHDQTVLEPGIIKTGSGGPMKVFTPYHKAWLAELKDDPSHLDLVSPPEANDKKASEKLKKLFGTKTPGLPSTKQFASDEEKQCIRSLWPPGHDAGMKRLKDFLQNKVSNYANDRSQPAKDPSSRLSPYFSTGTISVREVLSVTKTHNSDKNFDTGDAGIASWVREIVFREFYRQVLTTVPHEAMNLPQNLKFDFVQWLDDEEGWQKWCEGRTGVPFVDAGMRQLNTEAYMHNRLRMNVSSYLYANLLIDYRRGERYFATRLIDWDLSNNTQGWEPSYTVFNPVSQAERNDKDGEYIRKWVPELKDAKGKAVFAPHERLSKEEFEKLGYPKPHVEFKSSKDRAVKTFKRDLAEADP